MIDIKSKETEKKMQIECNASGFNYHNTAINTVNIDNV